MKLLFDQNLSPDLITHLQDLFPESNHVYLLGLDRVDDNQIRLYAGLNEFIVVTKDVDFSEMQSLVGSPPKIIWIRRGNCSTSAIEGILRNHYNDIVNLSSDQDSGVLTIY